ncbi:acetyl-CoA carboxylase biotin carboxylase subunit [Aquabacterium sp. UBA2148]|uniref:acetyl-CoA carboxylase biotin carboxylase subunit n=1 Tax=Aquabacterium sp. UBA2148 TaxID=1946042 RepID=UPI00257CBC28|nr:acetyl/propionyl/methylcrotonyl-CoA carboxylase subunit alpha [Aquabacterium sp. UBA2148]
MFTKILIANRGEIACRVAATARRLGIRTVAVYSEADAHARHVQACDEAVCIGPASPRESYLRADRILEVAKATGAQAVHPGYGFLSENEGFAQACTNAGIAFIGPPPSAIAAMGSKSAAKALMEKAGVPLVPGYHGDRQDSDFLLAQAQSIGFPVLIKASAGGGGKGMRIVRQANEFTPALASCQREAQASFGDQHVLIERYVTQPRHIEIQVFADAHGNVVHLGERDCSVQRRHQKVLEEAPAPGMSPELRAQMGAAAVAAAQSVGYVGAGTVEFICEQAGGAGLGGAGVSAFYFMEMNTRLQVEHPVTEMVSGFDLVEWQIRVAEGQPLPVKQEDITLSGHAIEARLYAEDPYAGFAPQTGPVQWWRPALALYDGVRIDDGIREGGEVTPHYDPMVAKLIVHGRDRADAIRRLMATLDDAPLLGLKHNARFLRDLVDHPRFRAGSMTTTLIDQWQADGDAILHAPVAADDAWLIAGALFGARQQGTTQLLRADSVSAWDLPLQQDTVKRTLRVSAASGGLYNVAMNPQAAPVAVKLLSEDATRGEARVELDGVQRRVRAVWLGDTLNLVIDAAVFTFAEVSAWPDAGNALDPSRALAPVAGTVTQVLVQAGDAVTEGQPLLAIEAMKMEMWLNAQAPGVIKAVYAKAGDQVQAKTLLIDIELNKED